MANSEKKKPVCCFDPTKMLDGERLTSRMRVSVQANGRLSFPAKVAERMQLTVEKCLLICPDGPSDLLVVVKPKETPFGFAVRRTGPYLYVPFRNLLMEQGLEFKEDTVIYDIRELAEQYEGSPVFRFERRIIRHAAPVTAEEISVSGEEDEEGAL